MMRFQITPFNSLLVTFGLTGIVEALIQTIWTADYRKLESSYGDRTFKIAGLFVPLPELITLLLAVGLSLRACGRCCATPTSARRCVRRPRTRRSPRPSASTSAATRCCWPAPAPALASVAGVCLALSFTLAPSQIYAWVGVVFAAVMLGGLGRALAPLIAGIVIGVSEAVTMAVTAPSWAPLVSFTLLIAILLFRPGRAA